MNAGHFEQISDCWSSEEQPATYYRTAAARARRLQANATTPRVSRTRSPANSAASASPSSIIPTAGWQSATADATCLTPPLTSCGRFRRPPSSRTSISAPYFLISVSSRSNARKLAVSPRHAVRGRSTICSKLAEGSVVASTSRHRTGSTALSPGPILCDGQDAVKPGPAGPRLRRLRA